MAIWPPWVVPVSVANALAACAFWLHATDAAPRPPGREGAEVDRFYVQPDCSSPRGLPREETISPQYLAALARRDDSRTEPCRDSCIVVGGMTETRRHGKDGSQVGATASPGVLVSEDEHPSGAGIRMPRPLWMEFILHFATLGVYAPFWLFSSVRELRTLTGRPFRPWLWLFVPYCAPAQFVAVPRFMRAWDAAGQQYGPGERFRWTVPATLAMVLLSIALPLSDVVADLVPAEPFLLGWLLCWAGLFSGIIARINGVKRTVPQDRFRVRRGGYSVPEWILLACLSPVTLLVFGIWAAEQVAYERLQALAADTRYVDENGAFSFPVSGSGWHIVAVGKYSDGDAVLEVEGPGATMHFVVFEHGRNVSIDDVVSWRLTGSRDELSGATCSESRRFAGNQPVVVSYLECEGRFVLDPSIRTATVFEKDGRVYELFGWLSPPAESFRRLAVGFRNTARGFEPL